MNNSVKNFLMGLLVGASLTYTCANYLHQEVPEPKLYLRVNDIPGSFAESLEYLNSFSISPNTIYVGLTTRARTTELDEFAKIPLAFLQSKSLNQTNCLAKVCMLSLLADRINKGETCKEENKVLLLNILALFPSCADNLLVLAPKNADTPVITKIALQGMADSINSAKTRLSQAVAN